MLGTTMFFRHLNSDIVCSPPEQVSPVNLPPPQTLHAEFSAFFQPGRKTMASNPFSGPFFPLPIYLIPPLPSVVAAAFFFYPIDFLVIRLRQRPLTLGSPVDLFPLSRGRTPQK